MIYKWVVFRLLIQSIEDYGLVPVIKDPSLQTPPGHMSEHGAWLKVYAWEHSEDPEKLYAISCLLCHCAWRCTRVR